jgi:predicted nucleotidyltransferase
LEERQERIEKFERMVKEKEIEMSQKTIEVYQKFTKKDPAVALRQLLSVL